MLRKALSLVELLVVLGMIVFVLSAVYVVYVKLFTGFRRESAIVTSQIETITNLDILRMDLQEAGFGIGSNCKCNCTDYVCNNDCLPIDFDKRKNALVVRSTYNLTNKKTRGWGIVDCTSNYTLLTGNLPSGASLVFLALETREIMGNGTIGTCPSSGIFLVFPYDSSVASGCINQFCNKIEYYLSTSSTAPARCATGTLTLMRKVGRRAVPVFYCIADFKVRFRWNGALVDPSTLSNISYEQEKNNLQQVNVYLLVQEGKRDSNLVFIKNKISVDGVDLDLSDVPDYQHYRWKVIKISVKPMNL